MRVYLDHNARAPLHPAAREAMTGALEVMGNPSSIHAEGQRARALLEDARAAVATCLGARSKDVVFTSGATEALHLALHGALVAQPSRRAVVVGATEHHAVLEEAGALARRGACELRVVPVDAAGRLRDDAWRGAVRDDVAVALVMAANNETGVLTDVAPLCAHARGVGALVVVDAAQRWGKAPLVVGELGADAVAVSACKIGGPPGAGALWLSDATRGRWTAPHAGGAQERGRRPGTENLVGAVGMGAAARAMDLARLPHVTALRATLEDGLRRLCPDVVIHGAAAARLGNTVFAGFPGVDAETLLMLLDQEGVAASSGSACVSGATTPSHVLAAMGVSKALARSSVRFSLGITTSADEVAYALATLSTVLPRARV
ncbi:MAG: cysteine desulfurase family protein [Myxococcota bacterium]